MSLELKNIYLKARKQWPCSTCLPNAPACPACSGNGFSVRPLSIGEALEQFGKWVEYVNGYPLPSGERVEREG